MKIRPDCVDEWLAILSPAPLIGWKGDAVWKGMLDQSKSQKGEDDEVTTLDAILRGLGLK